MRSVYIVGSGMIPVGKYTEVSLGVLGSKAIIRALESTELSLGDIGALYAGNMLAGQLCQQLLVSALLAQHSNLVGRETITAEGACASGAAAIRLGFMAIASGCHKAVLVCGVEKMTHCSREHTTQALATAADWETESSRGETFLSLNANIMNHYLNSNNVSRDQFSWFAINAHRNATTNPNALFRKSICEKTYRESRDIFYPLRLYDTPAICDGAACIILANEDIAKGLRNNGQPISKILASSVISDSIAMSERADNTRLLAAEKSATDAYTRAGLTPDHIDFFEPHDAYTIMSALSLEAAGFIERGSAVTMANDESIGLQGHIPICTFGGLKARGHPVGATGVYQMAEAFLQVTGRAKENQVMNANIGLIQNFSGTATVAFTNIIESY